MTMTGWMRVSCWREVEHFIEYLPPKQRVALVQRKYLE